MGTFHASCLLINPLNRKRSARVPRVLVDTGTEHTWISQETLKGIGIAAEKMDVSFQMANGQTISRDIGFAIVRVGEQFTIDEIVFARPGDLQLLGARSLEGLNLRVDSRSKKLIAAGPIPAA